MCSAQRRLQCVDTVFFLLQVKHVKCVEIGLRWMVGVGVGAKRAFGQGQSIHSMGLVYREVRILAQRATTPWKGLFIFTLITTHVLIIRSTYYKYVIVLSIFFSSAG